VQGVGPQVRAVELVLGQSPQLAGHVPVGDLHGLVQGLALGHLGDHARNGNGRPAAKGLELDVVDLVVLDLDIDAHHVTADRVADLAHTVGVLDLTHVARTLEVIHYDFRIHGCLP
jgi:hypothetical protein